MKSLSLGRYVLSSCVAIALLAGCGRSQLPSGASPDAATRFDNADSQTFHYTGKEQQFKVPPGVHKINVEAWGAAGAESDVAGGNGGRVSATIPVTPGEKLFVFVGGAASGAKGGFNGGADGGISNWYPKGCQNDCAGGGGGGASDIRRDGDVLHDRIFVAGGGGGAGGDDCKYDSGSCGSGPVGGGGGRQTGGTGSKGEFGTGGGGGGTQSKGGPGGAGGSGIYKRDKGIGQGRNRGRRRGRRQRHLVRLRCRRWRRWRRLLRRGRRWRRRWMALVGCCFRWRWRWWIVVRRVECHQRTHVARLEERDARRSGND